MLYKKAIRAILSNKRAYIACVFLISIGILMYTAMNTAGIGLGVSADTFYKDYNLADVFARVEGMPLSSAAYFADIDGVKEVEARYTLDVRAETPTSGDEILTLRLRSVTPEESMINKLFIIGNEWSGGNDIILNPAFAKANGLSIGDEISLFYKGREFKYTVCGTAYSPEHVYIVKNASEIMPDAAGFGVGYITADSMASLAGAPGLANDVVFTLSEGYTFDDVKIPLEDALAPFELKELTEKKNHPGYAFVDLEVSGISSMASSMPMVFMLMAAIVLYLMMKRVIEQERTQIGVLKAFGYSRTQIVAHYLCYGAVTGVIGGVAGCIMGYFLAEFYFYMFMEYFYMPAAAQAADPRYFVQGMVIAIASGVFGAFMGAVKALRLNPAEAMRPESPKPIKRDIVGMIKPLQYILTSRGNMALRSITRNPMRSSFVILGVMFSFSLLAISGSFNGIVDKLMFSQFEYIQRYGVKLSLIRPQPYDAAVEAAYTIDSVKLAEGLLEIPAELKHKHLKDGSMLTGISRGSSLYGVTDTNTLVSYQPPADGVILTNVLSDALRAGAGDTIFISSPLLDEDVPVNVIRVVEQSIGSGCYMEIGALSALFHLPKTATAIILNSDDPAYLKEHLKNSANVSTVDDKDTTLMRLSDMMGIYSSMYYVLMLMSAFVGFAIIYNTSTVALSERKREYATLRVIGLSVNEITEIMNFEYWVLGFVGGILGLPFVNALNTGMNSIMGDTGFTMPSTLPASAYATGAIGTALSIVLAGRSAKKKIRNFDMVEVLKERE